MADGVTPAGYYYAANNLFTAEHGGTHLDAPVHFAEGRAPVDRIPLERFFGPVALVDVTAQSGRNADYQVTVDDLLQWEREHGPMPPDASTTARVERCTRSERPPRRSRATRPVT